MDNEDRRYASCIGKIRYETGNEAGLVKDKKKQDLQVYRCEFCRGFHVGRRRRYKPPFSRAP